jgi:hypothetical protein
VKPSSCSRAVAVLVVAAILALPAIAAAEAPQLGKYAGGDGVSFTVGHTEHGTPVVEGATYHVHSGFERAFISGGSFETCARVRINSILFRDFCIHGSFGAPGHASGTVKVFQGAHGHRVPNPSETHHWTAQLLEQ